MKVRKIYKIGFFVLLLAIFIAVIGIASYVISFSKGVKLPQKKDCIVIFGASVIPGGKASPALFDRTKTAFNLYKKNLATCIILSGSQSSYGAHEVDVMRRLLLKWGMPIDKLEFDFDAKNTLATLKNLNKQKSYIFVSNDFHLARINLFAKYLGIKDYSLYPSEYTLGYPKQNWFWYIREMLAIIYYIPKLFMQ